VTEQGVQTASVGHGIGLRPPHYARLLEHGALGVPWFEAISENFFELAGRPLAVLERVRSDVPIALHGVALGIGGTDPISEAYLDRLARLIERIEPAWVSDHLCWGSVDGHYSHDLLPIVYTEESLEHIVRRVERVQARLKRRIMLENITAYLRFADSVIPEWEFLNELTRRTGAALLLDVNNVYVTGKNLGFEPLHYLERINTQSVRQIHLAGHTAQADFILDSHVGPVPDVVWDLYRVAVTRFGRVPTLVEWDEGVPDLETVLAEARRSAAIEREVLA
jgi:uncharacterized protein (UPF0276 family)